MPREATLPRELAEMALAVTDLIRQEFKSAGGRGAPTFTQFKVLLAVRSGVRQVGRLAERFGNSQPATSMMVDAMVQDGFLTRAPRAGDRRQVALRLTAKASARVEATYRRAFATMARRLAGLPAGARRHLANELRGVRERLAAASVRTGATTGATTGVRVRARSGIPRPKPADPRSRRSRAGPGRRKRAAG